MKKLLLVIAALSSTYASTDVFADTCTAPVQTGEYELVFSDEFNGDKLDRIKWKTEYLWGPTTIINQEQQYYVNEGQFGYDPFTQQDGVLSIQAIKSPFDRTQLYLTNEIYSDSTAELLWRTPHKATLYEIYRDEVLIGTATGGSFYDTGLDEGFDYKYQVTALDSNGNEIVSAQITINTARRYMPPPPSSSKSFSLNLDLRIDSESAAELVWDPPYRAGRFDVYKDGELYRSLVGRNYASLYETGLRKNAPHTYRVASYDQCGEFIIDGEITLDTADGPTPTDPPSTRLKLVDAIYSDTDAEILWDPVAGASVFEIYQDDELEQTTSGRSVFIRGLEPGIDRHYTVVALDENGIEVDRESRTLNSADNSIALNRQPYLSGVITSYDSFRFKYGKVETRARFPAGQGLWGAFWLLNAYYKQDQPEDPEIDIVEALGNDTSTLHHSYYHMVDANGDGSHNTLDSTKLVSALDDFSTDFHTYAVEWSEESLVFLVDGIETGRVTGEQVSSEQMYIIANLAVGGNFPGPADETTPFPAKLEIDYIRVWQRR